MFHGKNPDPERLAHLRTTAHHRRSHTSLRPRHCRHHGAPEHSVALGHNRGAPRCARSSGASRIEYAKCLRRCHPKRHGLPRCGSRCRRDFGCFAVGARSLANACRERGLLQPSPQVQDIDHRLPRVVPLSGDQRYWINRDGSRRRRQDRSWFLFVRHGWTPDSFLDDLQRRIGVQFDPAVDEAPPADVYRDHVGIYHQKQAGYCYVGAAVLRGRISAEQMRTAADLADRFASGELRTTNMQNLLIVNVPRLNADELAKELDAIGLKVGGSPFFRGTVACRGTQFCKLAITETKSFSRWLVEELEERLPGFDQHLKLHVTGCPNSCGQHWIADIGIDGKKMKVDGRLVDAYYFCLGGALGLHQATARPVGYRCPATEVPEAIERLLRQYLSARVAGENLRQFFARHTDTELR